MLEGQADRVADAMAGGAAFVLHVGEQAGPDRTVLQRLNLREVHVGRGIRRRLAHEDLVQLDAAPRRRRGRGVREQRQECHLGEDAGPFRFLREGEGRPVRRRGEGHLVDRRKVAVDVGGIGCEELAIVALLPDQQFDRRPQGLFAGAVGERLAELRIGFRVLRQTVEMVQLQHVGEERAGAVVQARRCGQTGDLPIQAVDGVQFAGRGGAAQLCVRRSVPEQEGETRGLAVAVEARLTVVGRIRFGALHAEQELGRNQQALQGEGDSAVEVGGALGAERRRSDPRGELGLRQGAAEELLADMGDDLPGARLVRRLVGHRPAVGQPCAALWRHSLGGDVVRKAEVLFEPGRGDRQLAAAHGQQAALATFGLKATFNPNVRTKSVSYRMAVLAFRQAADGDDRSGGGVAGPARLRPGRMGGETADPRQQPNGEGGARDGSEPGHGHPPNRLTSALRPSRHLIDNCTNKQFR
ncbi:hypothetical protein LRS10_00525 [Phenylobacterium sp. J426]|nr:hypothetical protein [Phenylobacterium sp. J426]MCR5872806.1 hypothetical protein [Phenylobacterium sp. J426]